MLISKFYGKQNTFYRKYRKTSRDPTKYRKVQRLTEINESTIKSETLAKLFCIEVNKKEEDKKESS